VMLPCLSGRMQIWLDNRDNNDDDDDRRHLRYRDGGVGESL